MTRKSLLIALVIVGSIAAIALSEATLGGQQSLNRRCPVVDPDLCTGCELCVETCPGVFCMIGDVATVCDCYGASEEEIQEAIDNCPVEAISWMDR